MTDLGISTEIASALSARQKDGIADLLAWDISKVSRRTQRRMGWSPSHRRSVEREYRRFIALLLINPDKEYGMAGEVDELWHDHILDTENYLAMCRRVVGGVVHHRPRDTGAGRKKGHSSAYEAVTYPDLVGSYSGRVSRIWPKKGADAATAGCCGHSVDRCAD